MVNKCLIWHLKTSNILSIDGCGFRQNHSTLDHLYINKVICRAINNKYHLIPIALHLEKTFGMVWCQYRVLQIIQKWGINKNLLLFLKSFLTKHSFQIKTKNKLKYLSNRKWSSPEIGFKCNNISNCH